MEKAQILRRPLTAILTIPCDWIFKVKKKNLMKWIYSKLLMWPLVVIQNYQIDLPNSFLSLSLSVFMRKSLQLSVWVKVNYCCCWSGGVHVAPAFVSHINKLELFSRWGTIAPRLSIQIFQNGSYIYRHFYMWFCYLLKSWSLYTGLFRLCKQ